MEQNQNIRAVRENEILCHKNSYLLLLCVTFTAHALRRFLNVDEQQRHQMNPSLLLNKPRWGYQDPDEFILWQHLAVHGIFSTINEYNIYND